MTRDELMRTADSLAHQEQADLLLHMRDALAMLLMHEADKLDREERRQAMLHAPEVAQLQRLEWQRTKNEPF